MYFLIDNYARNPIVYLITGNYANLCREIGINFMNDNIKKQYLSIETRYQINICRQILIKHRLVYINKYRVKKYFAFL